MKNETRLAALLGIGTILATGAYISPQQSVATPSVTEIPAWAPEVTEDLELYPDYHCEPEVVIEFVPIIAPAPLTIIDTPLTIIDYQPNKDWVYLVNHHWDPSFHLSLIQ